MATHNDSLLPLYDDDLQSKANIFLCVFRVRAIASADFGDTVVISILPKKKRIRKRIPAKQLVQSLSRSIAMASHTKYKRANWFFLAILYDDIAFRMKDCQRQWWHREGEILRKNKIRDECRLTMGTEEDDGGEGRKIRRRRAMRQKRQQQQQFRRQMQKEKLTVLCNDSSDKGYWKGPLVLIVDFGPSPISFHSICKTSNANKNTACQWQNEREMTTKYRNEKNIICVISMIHFFFIRRFHHSSLNHFSCLSALDSVSNHFITTLFFQWRKKSSFGG